ncbi:hypothetical protein [Domibacillus enclensis]|uniref:Resolvase, N terminal domain n=1 Tax=Domibacillus enclensis TaxID=1017273 RepID=A0A1N7C4S7_9BACI|nr:hypothetical protein [Domibacillus enclensis]OXS74240.1 hypothetical protein B1B05_17360 [Domibacillus enclensis]SIR58589.1 hypothetical protein SAMN05443094_11169 [Domibacillus enclensis]
MHKAVIYCQLEPDQLVEKEVEHIQAFIEKVDADIMGVFIDSHDSNDELMNMANQDLSVVSFLYLNKPLADEFDYKLLQELARQEQFEILYFDEAMDD